MMTGGYHLWKPSNDPQEMPRSRVQQLFSGSLQRFSEKQLEVGASKVVQKSLLEIGIPQKSPKRLV